MLADGKKWSCATCIKGHRASHCNHADRPLIEIKKKGRPMTQCQKCRELRVVRQLHVKCNCADTIVNTPAIKSKRKQGSDLKSKSLDHQLALRPIAPKPVMDLLKPLEPIVPKKCCASKNTSSKGITIQLSASLPLSPSISPPITPTTSAELNGFKASMMVPGVPVQCCPSKASAISSKIHPVVSATTKTTDHPRPPNIGPTDIPIPCCSIEKINPEGKRTRIVTCRCGDSCACPGCDAHPSRAMKTSRDPYTGFGADVSARRRLSIAAICEPVVCDEPSALLESCGCGCQQVFGSCLDEMLYAIHP